MKTKLINLLLLLIGFFGSMQIASAKNFKGKILGIKDQLIHVGLAKEPNWSKSEPIFLFDDEDVLKSSIQKIKSKQVWLKVNVSKEDILWEKGDQVLASADKPKIFSEQYYEAPKESMLVNYQFGHITKAHNLLLEDAKQAYDLQSPQGQLLNLSIEKRYSREKNFYSMGFVLHLGQMLQTKNYEAGDIKLKYQAIFAGFHFNVGFNINQNWYLLGGLQTYHPLHHEVRIDSPTGSVKHSPDSSFEFRTHASRLALGYRLSPKTGVEFGGIIKPILFGSFQGRGFTAITLGGYYAL